MHCLSICMTIILVGVALSMQVAHADMAHPAVLAGIVQSVACKNNRLQGFWTGNTVCNASAHSVMQETSVLSNFRPQSK